MHSFLPSQAAIRRFNDYGPEGLASSHTLRFVSETPLSVYNDEILRAIVDVPELRVVVAVRDPAEQFVSMYNMLRSALEHELPNLQDVVAAAAHYRMTGESKTGESSHYELHERGG